MIKKELTEQDENKLFWKALPLTIFGLLITIMIVVAVAIKLLTKIF